MLEPDFDPVPTAVQIGRMFNLNKIAGISAAARARTV
jgi:hypothetical protein